MGALLLMVLGGCGPTYNWPDSPSGQSALIALAKSKRIDMRWRRDPLTALTDDSAEKVDDDAPKDGEAPRKPAEAIVLLPGAEPNDREWAALLEWTESGHMLIVANGAEPPKQLQIKRDCTDAVAAPLTTTDIAPGPGLSIGVPPACTLVAETDDASAEIAREDGAAYAYYLRREYGELIVLADGALFTNVSLACADNATWLFSQLGRADGPVELVDALLLDDPFGGGDDVPEVDKTRLTALLIQGFLLAMLLLLSRGVHFGAPRDPVHTGRRAFAEHVRALGMLYARGQAKDHALRLYATWALDRLRQRMAGRRAHDLPSLAAAIAAQTGRAPDEVHALLDAAQRAIDSPNEPAVSAPLTVMARLSRLLKEVGGTTR
ncbi:MAG: hypothetical protein KC620_12860, partial [Myxococcales bacterium]|nr:hypothetical protein [Myxococcales bacterium]